MAQPNIQQELIKLLVTQGLELQAADLNPHTIGLVQPRAVPFINGHVARAAMTLPARDPGPEFLAQHGNLRLPMHIPVISAQTVVNNGSKRY